MSILQPSAMSPPSINAYLSSWHPFVDPAGVEPAFECALPKSSQNDRFALALFRLEDGPDSNVSPHRPYFP